MVNPNLKILEIIQRDPRFPYEAYEFLYQSLAFTQKKLGKPKPVEGATASGEHHVGGRELVEGVRGLALEEFGLMAHCVFQNWGIEKTSHLGDMVYNLVEAGLMSVQSADKQSDFENVFDLPSQLMEGYSISVPKESEE
ncbi:MAG: hypothetical protein EXR99_03260 [Gemmataceae bacterium]|nr:hypothetical protein [Gemmataceae bacterium]